MGNIQFGGVLGSFLDRSANRQVRTRFTGSCTVAVEANDALKVAARASFMKQAALEIQRALDAGETLLALVSKPELATVVGAAVSRELGVPVEGTRMSLGMSDEDAQALASVAPMPTAPTPRSCPSCGAPGAGKFCQGCGSAMVAAPPPPPPAATQVAPPPGRYLTSGINHPIAAAAHLTVHPGHCFVGFANGAVACNLQAGVHALPQACESGVYISLTGLPFVMRVRVNSAWMELRGALYIQDPMMAFRDMQTIDESYIDVLATVLGRCADKVAPTAADERQLCLGVAHAYPQDGDNIKGTVVTLESMRRAESS
jgi:hypothetical protein